MTDFQDFDLLNTPLEGTNLIEASAGTGKSFSIAGLFLRLVVEKHVTVREILVVTFTQAATEELRDRIRRRLREAADAFSRGQSEEAFLQGMIGRCKDPATALIRLREALRSFDQAAIMTIHGFCRRMLRENAFESGSLFDTELITDQEEIREEVVEDFWRRRLYPESALFVRYALQSGFSPGDLLGLLGTWYTQPHLNIIPRVPWRDIGPEERAFTSALEEVRCAWASAGPEAAEILRTTESLSRVSYPKEKIPVWVQGMEDLVSSSAGSPFLFDGFRKFTVREMERALRKGRERPSHPFFDRCEALRRAQESLLQGCEERLMALKGELFASVNAELQGRKRRKNVHSYDDLLLHLLGALQGKGGEELARAIRTRFRGALVDEFQDTDPVQYAIFRNIFSRGKGLLFLIGDPKQAIYGFRGADVFAYMEAAREVQTRFTLRENWRSEPGLIKAVNTLFGDRPRPFVFREIQFNPSVPAMAQDPMVFTLDGKPDAPLHLWLMEGESGDSIPKGEARELIHRTVAAEIFGLLRLGREGRAMVGGSPVREEDIAVLVRKNNEAFRLQQVLSTLRIPSVLYSTGNLFESHEAMELERVLMAVAAPEDGRSLRAALATDMLGLKAEDLEETAREEGRWEEWVLRFRGYQDLWQGRGFILMFRHLLAQEKVLARLMAFPDGERRNTNLLHLGEALHQAAVERKLDRSRLLQWLSQQRSGTGIRPEEHPIRLESDERAVKLVTVHKCKGLEYPIVFCPFGWDGSAHRRPGGPIVFHRGETPAGLTLDLGSEEGEENRRQAERENLAENLRLLYVSLTRAKARCTLVWGRFREAETSAPAYLLYPPPPDEEEDVVAKTKEKFLRLGGAFSGALRQLQEKSGKTLMVEPPPDPRMDRHIQPFEGAREPACRKFSGKIDREWRITSFSSLISAQAHAAERPDHDDAGSSESEEPAGIPETTAGPEPQGIFAFPAGTRAGSFLHDLLEHLDFCGEDEAAISRLIRDKLEGYGFAPEWEGTLREMIGRLLRVPLDPGDPDFRFSRVAVSERLNELEFYFPLKRIGPQVLVEVFSRAGLHELPLEVPERLGRLEFSPQKGFMKGYMDLVFRYRGRFYLVDWKSNHLGPTVEDYGEQGMAAAMHKGTYILQYHIYALALHRYLKWRLPGYEYETHFGGVRYVFLRGVDPNRGPQYGIYRARPSEGLMRALEQALIDDSAVP
ncbi:MAG: exodeoxyribonuclease V subunit beta [Thermodesulfobacteriota bacterium]